MSRIAVLRFIVCAILISIVFSLICLPKSQAFSNTFKSGKEFIENGEKIDEAIDVSELKSTSGYIYKVLFGIAVMVAIIGAMVIGIQFMAASADEKAKVKEALLPFVIGCIVVFGSFAIWKIVVNIGNDAEKTVSSGTSGSSLENSLKNSTVKGKTKSI